MDDLPKGDDDTDGVDNDDDVENELEPAEPLDYP